MRRKQLFAIILAGALAAGSAPAAVFAAESDVAAMSEEGTGDAGFEEAGSEDGSSDAETPVTDGGDAATDETPADNTTTDEPPADNTTTDEPPAADNTTTDETPATGDAAADATPTEEAQTQEQTEENKEVDKQEGETPTETAGIVLADAEGNQILDQDGKAMSYTTLEEAVAGAEAYSAAHPDAAVYIQLTESIELDKTITVSGKVNIRAVKTGVTISRKKDGTFTGTMFSVSGEGGQLQFFADSENGAALTVSGALPMNDIVETEAEGAIVDVQSNGTFVLNSGVTLTGNNYTGGGAAINCNGGTLMLAGGSVTNNISGDKGAVYSNTDISMLGDASVIGNKNIKDKDSNVYLGGDEAKLILTKTKDVGILTGKSTFTHAKAQAGRNVISGTTSAITKAEFEAAIKNITYDDTNYTLKADLTKFSVTLEEKKDTPTTEVDYKVTYKRNTAKWRSHTVAQANFTTTATCEWAYMVVNTQKRGKDGKVHYSILPSQLSEFTKAAANTEFTVVAENIPEKASTIIVVTRLNKNDTKYQHAIANLSESTRPAKEKKDDNNNNNNNTQQTKRTHKVTEGRVEGLDEPIKFFSKRYVPFTAIGAGTEDSGDYVNGDERWIPEYWTFEGSNTTHKTWSIGGSNGKGVQPKNGVSQEFTILIYCKKQVYNGKTFQDTAVEDCFPWKFTAASYTDEEEKQWLKDNGYITDDTDGDSNGDGSGNGSGAGGTDAELTATAAASAKDAGSKSKSAVSTADESPIGTMSVLAALSLLAGGYVVVRKRKKEEI